MPESLYVLKFAGQWYAYPVSGPDAEPDGVPVAYFPSEELANEFVKRWHLHYELTKACVRLLAAMDSVIGYDFTISDDADAATDAARAAVAKAEGK